MVRIRLRRVGLKNQPTYRIIAADKEAPRDGRFLEILGFYNPRTDPSTVEIKEDRLFDWMSKGAQPSESVVKILNMVGALDRFKRFKAGEALETLQAEAKEVYENRNTSSKTRLAAK
jgi:small subunit ribosomal protein S16